MWLWGEDDEEEEEDDDSTALNDEWLSPADGWMVDYEEEVMWELHYWARAYDRTQLQCTRHTPAKRARPAEPRRC